MQSEEMDLKTKIVNMLKDLKENKSVMGKIPQRKGNKMNKMKMIS